MICFHDTTFLKIFIWREKIMIKNIILDMGNVLLKYDPEVSLDLYCSSGEEKDIIRKELFEGPEWVMGDMGTIRDCERYDLVKKRVPQKHWEALKKCCDGWDICMEPVEGAREFCEYAKAQDFRVFVLSNASDLFYKYFKRFMPLDFFDGVIVSCDIHKIKPDKEIYEYVLESYGLNAGECLFVDDRPENVIGAQTVGMRAYEFRNDFEVIKSLLTT